MDFEAQAREMFDALDMSGDQLKEAAQNDKLLDSLLTDGRVGPGMRILGSLPPETLLNLLRSHQPLSLPVAELSPDPRKAVQEARAWLAASFAKHGAPKADIMKSMGPEPTQVGIGVDRRPDEVAPAFYLPVGSGSGQYFGGAWMEDAWRRKRNAEWMQPGDAANDPASARTLAPSKTPPPAPDQPHALANHVLECAEAAQVPLIARLPCTPNTSYSQPAPVKTIGAFLGQAEEASNVEHKWRGGILLLTCQNWFMGESEDARLPWTEVRRLRDAEATGDGFLSLDDLAHAAAVLNEAQMKSLGEWFSVMNNAAEWHDFLVFYDKTPEYRPRVLSAKGDDFQYPESLVNAQLGIDALRLTHPNLRLQIQQKLRAEGKPPTRLIMFAVRDDDGIHALNGRGFGYTAREYQASLQVDEGTRAVTGKTSPTR